MQFIYVLPGWEGSAADSRVLRDAISRRNGFVVPRGSYYLVDAGYTNGDGFLAPFRGQRYHLNDWSERYQPTTAEEFFNMRHASARNIIERQEMGGYQSDEEILEDESEREHPNSVDEDEELVTTIEPSNEWTTFRQNLAVNMFNTWRARHAR
ncbi:UNVERIFIED_CONTAM: hypothetical protein Slati_1369600 [Sesamum latifolium]|uniref:DDE Tnp4 domain-containing protein n=1 Tax=Sesamum latifolium TaxID=2727402 RepID=A0AAW2XQ22_9LAMI